jgi:hypothetical protein
MLCRNILVVVLLVTAIVAVKGEKKNEKPSGDPDLNVQTADNIQKRKPKYPPPEGEEDCDDEACVKLDGSKQCWKYSTKQMAATADEAVLNFVDLTTPTEKKWVPTDSANANGLCQSNTCKGCMQMFIDQVEKTLPTTSDYNTIRQSLALKKQSFGTNNYRSYCTNLQNVTQPIPPPNKITTTDLASIMTSVIGRSTCDGANNTSAARNRKKRQTVSNIGTSSPLNCNYRRGNNMNDGSSYVGLCNLCNSVRTLPSQYFPRFINELSCQSSDNRCLSGYGTCRERYRSIEVLINYGTDTSPRYAQYSINTPVGCECQLLAGSALSTLASG